MQAIALRLVRRETMDDAEPPHAARHIPGESFRGAEEAWFWTMGALAARREGRRSRGVGVVRPCEPDDVVCCLDRLYKLGKIRLAHARVLRAWGERGERPDPRVAAERAEAALWDEALARLDWLRRVKGIVG